jgi:hypothetical protein
MISEASQRVNAVSENFYVCVSVSMSVLCVDTDSGESDDVVCTKRVRIINPLSQRGGVCTETTLVVPSLNAHH